jgi:hypothetical protein
MRCHILHYRQINSPAPETRLYCRNGNIVYCDAYYMPRSAEVLMVECRVGVEEQSIWCDVELRTEIVTEFMHLYIH